MAQPIDAIATTAVGALQTLIAEPRRSLPRLVFRSRLDVRGSIAPLQ